MIHTITDELHNNNNVLSVAFKIISLLNPEIRNPPSVRQWLARHGLPPPSKPGGRVCASRLDEPVPRCQNG